MFQRKKPKKPVAPWRQNILAHHQDRPSSADRGEFPRNVVAELIAEAGGKCQCGCGKPDQETHHVRLRSQQGRGVKSNGMRLNSECHRRIHDDPEELQHWFFVYQKRFGEHFWFDEQDWEEYNRKQAETQAEEELRRQRAEELSELFALLQKSTKLTTGEKRRLGEISDRHIAVLVGVLRRSMGTGVPDKGYGWFKD